MEKVETDSQDTRTHARTHAHTHTHTQRDCEHVKPVRPVDMSHIELELLLQACMVQSPAQSGLLLHLFTCEVILIKKVPPCK